MAVILHHETRARRTPAPYILGLAGMGLAWFAGARWHAYCGAECEAPWLWAVAFAFGALLAGASLLALILNTTVGSEVDTDRQELRYWSRSMKSRVYRLDLRDVDTIRIDRRGDNPSMSLLANGRPKRFAGGLIGMDWEEWARQVVVAFPHMRVEIAD